MRSRLSSDNAREKQFVNAGNEISGFRSVTMRNECSFIGLSKNICLCPKCVIFRLNLVPDILCVVGEYGINC